MDKQKVIALTLSEIEEAVKMRDALLAEAVAAEELIRTTYLFDKMKEERIVVWTDGYNYDYVTKDGVWQADYLHRQYRVHCTVEGIFEVIKGGYFMHSGTSVDMKQRAQLWSYFKWFLEKTRTWKEKNVGE